jgi:hypothetical protein
MAHTTGTAANATVLYDALINFLKTDAALVSAGQAWTEVWTGPGTEKVLRGPGMSGTDNVYIGFKLETATIGDAFRLILVGMSGVIPGALTFDAHVNVSPKTSILLDVNPMVYWFTASGRRFVVAAKMSTVYESCYAGLFLPYGSPAEYPLPLVIGGSSLPANNSTWRSVSDTHAAFCYCDTPTIFFLDPLGIWNSVKGSTTSLSGSNGGGHVLFPGCKGIDQADWDTTFYNRTTALSCLQLRIGETTTFDGQYALTPFTITKTTPSFAVMGTLDGVHSVSGVSQSAENLITVDTIDHIVVPNVFRTGRPDYFTIVKA